MNAPPPTTAEERARLAGVVEASDAVGAVVRSYQHGLDTLDPRSIDRAALDALKSLIHAIDDVDPAVRAEYADGICEVLAPVIVAAVGVMCLQRMNDARTGGGK